MSRQKAPGKYYRKGMSLVDVIKLFPTDKAAEKWLIEQRWPEGVDCPHCHSKRIHHNAKHRTMPMRCRDCRKWFSVRSGTAMQGSKLGYQKWILAFYLMATGIKGVSSMKLHRDLGITQKSAWFLAHRIRECWDTDKEKFSGPVEADETYFGGKRKNMPKYKREKLIGRGPVGKTAVVGVKDRETKQVAAKVAESTDKETIQGFVKKNIKKGAKLYTDDHRAYSGMTREVVKHSIGEYVKGKAHTNGIESFWSMMKRGYYGTYHRMSPAHLNRYVNEFTGRHNDRPNDTIDQLSAMASGLPIAETKIRVAPLISVNKRDSLPCLRFAWPDTFGRKDANINNRVKMRLLIIGLLSILLTGCATPPTRHHIKSEQEFSVPLDIVWEGVIDFFTKYSIPIKTIEKDSGLIYAEHQYNMVHTFTGWADCGTTGMFSKGIGESLSLNVFVRDHGRENKTVVGVNSVFKRVVLSTGQVMPNNVNCYSTGVLEGLIFNHIGGYISEATVSN